MQTFIKIFIPLALVIVFGCANNQVSLTQETIVLPPNTKIVRIKVPGMT